MSEKEKVLNQLQNLGIQTDIFGESLDQNPDSQDKVEIKPEMFGEDNTLKKEEKTPYKKGLDYAVRILSLRDYSTHKMKQKLKERKIPKEDSDKIIEQLLKWNYLREEEYTKQRIKMMVVKGYANSLIKQKLSQEHLTVDEVWIDELREEQDLSSETQLDYLIRKKLRGKEIPSDFESKMKLKNKILRFLISKGYSFNDAVPRLSTYFDN